MTVLGKERTTIPLRKILWIGFGVTLALGVFLAHVGNVWQLFRWAVSTPSADMQHIWLIPFGVALLIRHELPRIRAALTDNSQPSLNGLLFLLAGVLLWWGGALDGRTRLACLGCYIIFWSACLAFFGRRFARALLAPAILLLFSLPLNMLIDRFTLKLRTVVAIISSELLNGFGIPVERVGTGLKCLSGAGFNLDIVDSCSGLRSFTAIAALTFCYGCLTLRGTRRRAALFACTIPIAMLGNIVRIVLTAIVARLFGSEIADEFHNPWAGYIAMILNICTMLWVANLLAKTPWGDAAKKSAACEQSAKCASPRTFSRKAIAVTILAPALPCLAMFFYLNAPQPFIEPQTFIAEEMPQIEGYEMLIPRYCQEEQCSHSVLFAPGAEIPDTCPLCGSSPLGEVSLGEKNLLYDSRQLKANYISRSSGRKFVVDVVITDNPKAQFTIHRPEACLPAHGFVIKQTTITELPSAHYRNFSVNISDLTRSKDFGAHYAQAYFYLAQTHQTASHTRRVIIESLDRVFRNRITRWAMVTVFSDSPLAEPDSKAELTRLLDLILPQIWRRK